MTTRRQPIGRAQALLTLLAISVVFGCVGIKSLAPGGWVMFFFAIPYFVMLSTHAYTHIIYAKLAPFSMSQYSSIVLSHLLLIVGVLFQWDFTDTAFTWAPITELLPIAPITATAAHGWQFLMDLLVLFPTIVSWLGLWSDRKQTRKGRASTPTTQG